MFGLIKKGVLPLPSTKRPSELHGDKGNTVRRPKLELLTAEDVNEIIEAAYDLLENFGVMVDNQEALQILADGGARVDIKKKVALIPPAMVDKALESAPSAFTIHGQPDQRPAMLEGDNIHFLGTHRRKIIRQTEIFTRRLAREGETS